jgi:hypothetical protein
VGDGALLQQRGMQLLFFKSEGKESFEREPIEGNAMYDFASPRCLVSRKGTHSY